MLELIKKQRFMATLSTTEISRHYTMRVSLCISIIPTPHAII
ncbi:hypothetical protein HMPREF1400_01435 [Helicobacter pylori GAM119Bi]|nr:hypothetical protein HMPREF1400_01435 [Helicobacter pylori GAM119Bi]EMH10770.1 hypothetical protein HMPREF1409_00314 [Helicobacter pylori GAM246Ai]